MLYKSCPFTK